MLKRTNFKLNKNIKKIMSVIAKKLDQVLDRTQKLVELSKALQEQNDLVNLENQSLKVALESSENKRKEVEEKLRVVKLAKSLEGTSEKTLDIKQKINEFVREIDKCIVLLNK
ncbi:MAG TPA: hypothetical protein VL125_08620 [Pelobium sp.]|nr:hypothetical protein [Pelobium sp.]